MSSIKSLLDAILKITNKLSNEHVSEPDEYVAIKDIELSVHEARKVFERTKKINDEKPSTIQKAETDSP